MADSGYSSTAAPASGGGAGGVVPSGTGERDYDINRLSRQYQDFVGAKSAEIDEQRLARHYYHADQFTAKEVAELNRRRQPITTRNRTARKINGIVGLVERLRQDPKGFPRTPKEDERGGADVATAAIRYVLDQPNDDDADWPSTAAGAALCGSINGVFGVELALTKGDHGDPDVTMALVDPDTFFYDPRSFKHTFTDARYMGVAKWIDLELAQEMFPDKAEDLAGLVESGGNLSTWQQRDREIRWVDSKERRIFLVEHWYVKAGEWRYCFYTGATELQRGQSPFVDERGKTFCRFLMGSVNIDHDGDRYGFVRNLKGPQDEINARAIKALHILNTRRVIYTKGIVPDVDAMRRELVRPDGAVEINPLGPTAKFELDDAAKQADLQGQLEFLAEAKDEIENFGPNPALIGQGIENKSGRAIALLQQAGIAELGPFILVYRGWKLRVYRAIWNTIQRYWTAERWIRVTDDEGLAQFLQLNGLTLDEMGRPAMVNALGSLDVDIILDEGPDTINLMQDTYDALQALAQSGQPIPPEVLIELSPIPSQTKRKVLDILEKAKQPGEMEVAGAKAKLDNLQAKTAKDIATARKTEADIPGGQAKAMRDRAGAFRDIAAAATDIHRARREPPPGMGAEPSDGGLGQFS